MTATGCVGSRGKRHDAVMGTTQGRGRRRSVGPVRVRLSRGWSAARGRERRCGAHRAGVLSLRATRLRSTGEAQSTHAVEHAVIAACPRSKRVEEVIDTVGRSQPLDDLARRLVCLGLLSGRRQRTTRAGRRLLAAAASEGSLPRYVLEGPAVLVTGPVRHGLLSATSIPDGLDRTLRRMGKALDDDHSSSTDSAPGGGIGCGGSSGGD